MMRRAVLCCACFAGAALAASADDYRFSGPYTHDNLSIYLIHGAKRQPERNLLTLQEALDQKKVVVYETGNVNELAIENLSNEVVYIQSGDIVKGGRQDRVFPEDFMLPTKSGKVPIASFCVEHGRWTRRGSERADRFSTSNDAIAGKSLKMAARKEQDQGRVWQQVAVAEARMARVVAVDGVAAPLAAASPSSMQLTLENRELQQAADRYIKQISKAAEGQPDVVGYAFAINGRLNSGDVYSSAGLFQKMWPKLIKASAMEALTERRGDKKTAPPDVASVRAAFAAAERGKESSKQIGKRLDWITRETDQAAMFETRDQGQSGAWIHKSYIIK